MVQSKATTVKEYLDELPADRRKEIANERGPAARQMVGLDRVDEHPAPGVGDLRCDVEGGEVGRDFDPVSRRVRRLGHGRAGTESDEDR